MFKRCIAILLIIALIASSFQRFVAYAGFELNRSYIANTLCVNKSRPWMHCNGHCYFMRKVKEAQQREAGNEREAQKNLFQEAEVSPISTVRFHSHLLSVINTPYTRFMTATVAVPLFRPPRQVSDV